jgi:hypothetical protein
MSGGHAKAMNALSVSEGPRVERADLSTNKNAAGHTGGVFVSGGKILRL